MSHPLPHTPSYSSTSTSTSDDDSFENVEIAQMKPRPRGRFELSSPPASEPPTPSATTPVSPSYLQAPGSGLAMDGSIPPSRTQSFLNLTTSTLFGIYKQTGFSNEREEAATPWGTGAQTPARSRGNSLDLSKADKALSNGAVAYNTRSRARRRSNAARQPVVHRVPRRGFKGYYLPLIGRIVALACVGVLYGLLITHLHDRRDIAPTKVEINRRSWNYLGWWGFAGIALGEAMPWVDTFWAPDSDEDGEERDENEERRRSRGLDGWIDVVRSIGAFVGIAFAIRKLPWQSTLQLSLTLALANPAIWFIVDRSPPGFVLSTCFALAGTLLLLGMNPALMPSPSPAEVLRSHVFKSGGSGHPLNVSLASEQLILGIFTQDSVGVATWIASVLFVSSVCFGNVGRRLSRS